MTSRHYLIDLIELIWNDIALLSHYQELMNSYEKEDMTEYQELYEKSIEVLDRRRECMKLLETITNKPVNQQYRCIVKHSISSYQFATECLYADINNTKIREIQQRAYETMIENMCKYLWIDEIVSCWRCMTDKLLDHNNKQ